MISTYPSPNYETKDINNVKDFLRVEQLLVKITFLKKGDRMIFYSVFLR